MTHDNRYKLLFSSKEIVKDFLKYFTLKNLDQRIELESLEMLDTKYSIRKGDQVWKAKFKNNQDIFFLLMLEFQSTIDYKMPVRIATYTGELYQKLNNSINFKDGFLPFVLPIVIYNGDSAWDAKINVQSMYDFSQDEFLDLKKYQLSQEYLLLDISKIDYNQQDDSLFKYLFELESGCLVDRSVIDVLRKIAILRYSDEAMHLISYFVKSAIQRNDKTLFKQIENSTGNIMTIADTIEREIQKVKFDAKQEGLNQAKIDNAKNALNLGLTVNQVMLITGLSLEEIEKIQINLKQ